MAKGGLDKPEISKNDWLWRLDSIEQKLEKIIPSPNVKVLFTIKLKANSEERLVLGSTEEIDGFPYGKVISITGCSIWGNVAEQDSAMWLNLGCRALPFFLRWDLDAGWSVHKLPPPKLKFVHQSPACQWSKYYYLDKTDDKEASQSIRNLPLRLVTIEESVASCFAFAPASVLKVFGNLSLMPCWATALFYLALKAAHPLLSASGYMSPRREPDSKTWQGLQDGWIQLEPDFRTATKYAFEAFHQLAKAKNSGGRLTELKELADRARKTILAFQPSEGRKISQQTGTDICTLVTCLRELGRDDLATTLASAFDRFSHAVSYHLHGEAIYDNESPEEEHARFQKDEPEPDFGQTQSFLGALLCSMSLGLKDPEPANVGTPTAFTAAKEQPAASKEMENTPGLRIKVKFKDGNEKYVELSSWEQKTLSRSLFFLFAQAYYKILECVSSSPVGWTDLGLNQCYQWIVKTIQNQLSQPYLKGFPGKFEPFVEHIFPSSGLGDLGWEDFVAPHAEDFLARAQEFVASEQLIPLEEGSVAHKIFELKKSEVMSAIEAAQKFYTESERKFKFLLANIKPEHQSLKEAESKNHRPDDRPSDHAKIVEKSTSRSIRKTKEELQSENIQLFAALMQHHKYTTSELNFEPAGQKDILALLGPDWNQPKISRAMKRIFGKNPMAEYRRKCRTQAIAGFLKKQDDGGYDTDASQYKPIHPTEKEEKLAYND